MPNNQEGHFRCEVVPLCGVAATNWLNHTSLRRAWHPQGVFVDTLNTKSMTDGPLKLLSLLSRPWPVLHRLLPVQATGPTGVGITSPTRAKRAISLILEGIGVARLPLWVAFTYHEAALPSLTQALDDLVTNTGETLQGIQEFLYLSNVVLDNRLSLDYLLAKRGGVCAASDKTCGTYMKAGQIKL